MDAGMSSVVLSTVPNKHVRWMYITGSCSHKWSWVSDSRLISGVRFAGEGPQGRHHQRAFACTIAFCPLVILITTCNDAEAPVGEVIGAGLPADMPTSFLTAHHEQG